MTQCQVIIRGPYDMGGCGDLEVGTGPRWIGCHRFRRNAFGIRWNHMKNMKHVKYERIVIVKFEVSLFTFEMQDKQWHWKIVLVPIKCKSPPSATLLYFSTSMAMGSGVTTGLTRLDCLALLDRGMFWWFCLRWWQTRWMTQPCKPQWRMKEDPQITTGNRVMAGNDA